MLSLPVQSFTHQPEPSAVHQVPAIPAEYLISPTKQANPGPCALARFAISVRNTIKENPFKSLCIALALIGAGVAGGAYLIAGFGTVVVAGCVVFGIGTLGFYLMHALGSSNKEEGGHDGDDGQQNGDSAQVRLNLEPVNKINPRQDFDNMIAEIFDKQNQY